LPNLRKSLAFSEKAKLFHRLNDQNLGHWGFQQSSLISDTHTFIQNTLSKAT